MDKKYWFVNYMINRKEQITEGHFGFVSDDQNLFSINNLKKVVLQNFPNINPNTIVIRNFYEFERESDYINFWHK